MWAESPGAWKGMRNRLYVLVHGQINYLKISITERVLTYAGISDS